MTLATSSSIHQATQFSADRQAEIRRDAERTRLSVSKAPASRDVLPEGVDDLTPAVDQPNEGQTSTRTGGLMDGILTRLMPTRPARA